MVLPLSPCKLNCSSYFSLTAAGLAILACLAAIAAAFLPARGHPPLSDYVGAIAVLVAWVLSLFGVTFAVVSRRSVDKARYMLALAGNIAALVVSSAIWFLWSLLRSA